MSIRSAVYELLSGIESDSYPLFAPQELTDPYAVYEMRQEPILTQDDCGPIEVDLTIRIYAKDFDLAVSLAETIFAGMDDTEGTYDDKELMLSRWVSESDDYIGDLDKVVITQDYNLKFK